MKPIRRQDGVETKVGVALLWILALATPSLSVESSLNPLPFDPALSMYVGHLGTWYVYNRQKHLSREIEDYVAGFTRRESVSFYQEVCYDHIINEVSYPDGWLFFEPVKGRAMKLRLLVRDSKRRIGNAVVKDRLTGKVVGIAHANRRGSILSGLFSVAASTQELQIQVNQRNGQPLFAAAAFRPSSRDLLVYPVVQQGWEPNHGKEAIDKYCPSAGNLHPPWGDPRDLTGKSVIPGRFSGYAEGACWHQEYENDSQNGMEVKPTCDLRRQEILKDSTTEWLKRYGPLLPARARQSLLRALDKVRSPYDRQPLALQPSVRVLPYSRGTIHWTMGLEGQLLKVLFMPYNGKRWTPGFRSICAGELWSLRVSPWYEPCASYSNLMQSVTIKLVQMINGQPQAISGRVRVTRIKATTTPSSPGGMGPGELDVPPAGVAVDMGKGWEWKVESIYQPGASTIQVPAQNPIVTVVV